MALVKTIAEVKTVIPTLSNLSNQGRLPDMDKAAWKYIVPVLGQAFYDSLHTKYNAVPQTLAGKEVELVKKIQLPLVAFAYLDNSGLLHATISDNGIRRISTGDMPTVYKWEFDEVMNNLRTIAHDGLEILLDYLFTNKADFNAWTTGSAYAIITNRLIKTGVEFNDCYTLFQPYRTFWKLLPVLKDAEENYMVSTVGRSLLNWVKSKDDIKVTEAGAEIDVKQIFKRAAAYYTIFISTQRLPVRFGDDGFTVFNAGGNPDNPEWVGRTRASASEILELGKQAKRDGDNYLSQACNYLKKIHAEEVTYTQDSGFTTAFNQSPLSAASVPYDNGNSKRKIFRFG